MDGISRDLSVEVNGRRYRAPAQPTVFRRLRRGFADVL